MNDISGSVNVSEILGTLTNEDMILVRTMALDICRGECSYDRTMRFCDMRERLAPFQVTAVTALLTEVRRRRDELLKDLMDAVDEAIFEGADFRQKIGETRKEGSDA